MVADQSSVVVAGAGPGGVITAWCLAQKNIPVKLLDKAVFPRDKVCGDALSGKVVEVLKKVAPDWLADFRSAEKIQLGSYGVTFQAPNGKKIRIPFKQAFSLADPAPGFISKRIDFDDFLLKKAIEHPLISFMPGTEIKAYHSTGDQFEVEIQNAENIYADYVIGADGAHSRLAKQHGFKVEPPYYCAAVRGYFSGVKGMDTENFIELLFYKKLLPGYCWIFPLPNGMANVGLGIRSDKVSKQKLNLKQLLNELITTEPDLKKRFVDAKQEGEIKGFGLPLGSKRRSISGEGYVLTGDAASLIDPFTGEGIGNAMVSGMYAADIIEQAIGQGRRDAAFFKAYDQQVYARLWDELKLSYRMQQLVQYPWLFDFVVNKANSNATLRETISCMFEDVDLRQQFRSPAFYWKLLWG